MRYAIAALMALMLLSMAIAQDQPPEQAPQFAFKGGISLGVDTLPTGPAGAMEGWNRLGFQPDLSFGKFGIGLDLSFRFQMGADFTIYPGDWVPGTYNGVEKNILDIYLPKFMYVRYGEKGDPLFAKLGSIDDLSLGNGFIMSNYSNTRFLPDQRIFGLDFGLDGALFGMPIAGLELLTGNLARFDVIGGRFFLRPLIGTELPILKNAQLGVTGVVDLKPYLYFAGTFGSADPLMVYGFDVTVPILSGDVFSLAVFGDVAMEPQGRTGEMLGFGGRLIGIFTYGAQLRFLQKGFIPSYFDSNYDIYRSSKYDYINDPATANGAGYAGWYASLGTSLLSDSIVFMVALDGPFGSSGNTAQTDFPHLRSVFHFDIEQLPIFIDASYEKYYLGENREFFNDLVNPENAIIGMSVNYRTGASVLTLKYDATYNPDTATFTVKSSIQASVQF